MHCATLEGREARKPVPDGKLIFGGHKDFTRRREGLIDKAARISRRLLPLASRGDELFQGNWRFRLSDDAHPCTFSMHGRKVDPSLAYMATGARFCVR